MGKYFVIWILIWIQLHLSISGFHQGWYSSYSNIIHSPCPVVANCAWIQSVIAVKCKQENCGMLCNKKQVILLQKGLAFHIWSLGQFEIQEESIQIIQEFSFHLYNYLYWYNVFNIPTLLTTILHWFPSSEFKCFWLVAGNKYLQCDGVREVGVLGEDGGLTIRVLWGACIQYLKRACNGKSSGKQKFLKSGSMLGKGMGALKRGGFDSLTNYAALCGVNPNF